MLPFFEVYGVVEKDFFRFFPLKNYQFPLHFHRAYELIFVNEGQLQVMVDGNEYALKQHDAAFIFPNQMHEFVTPLASEITIIQFSPELIGDFHMNYISMVPLDSVLHIGNTPDFTNLTSIYRQKSFLYAVCAELISQTSFVPVTQSPQTVLHKILLYVEQHYASECNLKAVAEHLRYDYPYLSKLFVRVMKMTFTDYLNHYRILKACYELKHSQLTIGEVAVRCGYSNLRSFHRNFKKVTHCQPKEYRVWH